MEKQTTIAEMFQFLPGTIQLIGFPSFSFFNKLSTLLSQEVTLRKYQREVGGRKVVTPSFTLDHVAKRELFFQSLPKGFSLNKSIFEREFPKNETTRFSLENFLYFCERVYETREALRRELGIFKQVPEARSAIRRLQDFDAGLENTLRALKSVEGFHTFAMDTQSGVIVNIDRMPAEASSKTYLANKSRRGREESVDEVKVQMKKVVLNLVRLGKDDFKERIIRYVRDEFGYNPEVKNLRAYFEELAVPIRLHTRYARFLDSCISRIEGCNEEADEPLPEIASPNYPEFGKNYDISNLFPPSLLDEWDIPEEVVPINFKTKPHENKFLLAGLHSGGKSFLLENIVLASLVGQIPLPLPSDSLVLPRYNRIFYYRNVDNSGTSGRGKALKEIRDINLLINNARKGDLLVFDEFLDSLKGEIATWLSPELLGRLGKLKDATVFVSTHGSNNYFELERNGWAIMSPGYKIQEGHVVPTHIIEQGRPNEKINRRYVHERYEEEQKG